MGYDPVFRRLFCLKTKIRYISDVEIDPRYVKGFTRSWKAFYSSSKNKISPSRRKIFSSFFKRLKSLGTDEPFCKKVAIRFVNRKMGYGVFALEDIGRYALLNHYAGVLTKDSSIGLHNKSTFTFQEFPRYSLDAEKRANWCRFMNHSEEGNVLAWEYYLPEGPRIIYTAGSKGIKKGEQLLYSYGDDYWTEEDVVL